MFQTNNLQVPHKLFTVENFFRQFNNHIMEGFGQLLAFSLVMLFGSYAAGSLPLFVAMSEKNLHLVSVLGAGLLLGVALAVIIPEGLQTLIKAYNTSPAEMGNCTVYKCKMTTGPIIINYRLFL
jgi:hypothetical protein